ncbi:MAG TPA: DUF1992 domain-containing protein [Acidobacteriota bacterium]|nr:DUF1992 domain-containing protein [Acidobacteriota bacterium]
MDIDKIAEDKIREAMEEGEFDNLPGRGKPLHGLGEYFATPENVRVGYSVLKNSGFVPEEVSLLKEIDSLKARLKACAADSERAGLLSEIRGLQLKYDLIIDSYRRNRR